MKTEGTNLHLLKMSAFLSSSRWPLANHIVWLLIKSLTNYGKLYVRTFLWNIAVMEYEKHGPADVT